MEPGYNVEKAKLRLQQLTSNYALSNEQKTLLLSTINTTQYGVIQVEAPCTWRITKTNEGGLAEAEEEVFELYGIICMCDLPPIKSKDITNLKKKALYLRQAIRLTGLGTTEFDGSVDQIEKLHKVFEEKVEGNTISQWEPAIYEGYKAIDINARYFTLRRNAPHEKGQAFQKGVDPDNTLAEIRGQDMIHGNDNRVEYLSEMKDAAGNTRMTRIEPSHFKTGDLVRASISIVVFPRKSNTGVMTLMLKALTYIESISTKKEEDKEQYSVQKTAVIKRKVLFEDDAEAREGIAAMSINDEMKE